MLEMNEFPNVIELNVGGQFMTTKLSTLTKDSGSLLADVFTGKTVTEKDKDGRYFIDCDGDTFAHILEFLRFGTVPPILKALDIYRYAKIFRLSGLTTILEKYYPVRFQTRMRKVIEELGDRRSAYEDFRNKVLKEIQDVNSTDRTLIPIIYVLNDEEKGCGKDHSLMVSSYLANAAEVRTLNGLSDKCIGMQTVFINDATNFSQCLAHDLCELGYCSQGFYFDSLNVQNCRNRANCGFSWKTDFVFLSRDNAVDDKRLKRP